MQFFWDTSGHIFLGCRRTPVLNMLYLNRVELCPLLSLRTFDLWLEDKRLKRNSKPVGWSIIVPARRNDIEPIFEMSVSDFNQSTTISIGNLSRAGCFQSNQGPLFAWNRWETAGMLYWAMQESPDVGTFLFFEVVLQVWLTVILYRYVKDVKAHIHVSTLKNLTFG